MHHAPGVRRLQSFGGLDRDVERVIQLERTIGNLLPDRLAIDERHRDERPAVCLVDLVNRADAGMVERGRCLCLSNEPLTVLRTLEKLAPYELQGDRPCQLRVFGPVNDTHSAFADFVDDAVMGDRRSNHSSPGWRRLCTDPLESMAHGFERIMERSATSASGGRDTARRYSQESCCTRYESPDPGSPRLCRDP